MSDHAREIRYALTDPFALCERLGLMAGRGSFVRQGPRGVTVRCAWHTEKSPSMSVTRGPDGTIRAKCFSCDASGDALALIGQVRGISPRTEFRALLVEAAHLAGLFSLAAELESGKPTERPAFAPPVVKAEPERTYPDPASVSELLATCRPVTDDAEIAAHLAGRGIDPEAVASDELAVALPSSATCPRWATYQSSPWTETGHRLLLPMRGPSGDILSVRAWRVTENESPKRLPPGGCKASGLVLACPLAVAWLRGTWSPSKLLVAEGEPDFLAAASMRLLTPHARLGIVSGSWTPALSQRCRAGLEVFVFTDRDKAGDRYAAEIVRSVRARGCVVHRWKSEAA